MKTVAFTTFGCRLNQYDTETLRTLLKNDGGWQTVALVEPAHGGGLDSGSATGNASAEPVVDPDVVVVNTCTVTARADAGARKAIRRIHKTRPDAVIVVTGCYAQRAPEELAELPGVRLVLGAADRGMIASKLDALARSARGTSQTHSVEVAVSPITEARTFLDVPITEMMTHSRAYVKVQEGCDESCTFCIVPQTRGASRSRRPDSVLRQIRELIGRGYSEIVLTGVHLGDYGLDLPGADVDGHSGQRIGAAADDGARSAIGRSSRSSVGVSGGARRRLTELVGSILELNGLARFRLSSIEPASIQAELIELMARHARFARHFHIPCQSGSDAILERMQRRYRAAEFQRLVESIHEKVPGCGIGCDVICGFPGETDADFAATFDLLEGLPLSYVHPFSYSVRPGSAAQAFGDQVTPEVKKRRVTALKKLFKDKNRTFRLAHVGQEMDVVIESGHRHGVPRLGGWTDNYLRVDMGPGVTSDGLKRARITGLTETGLSGELLDP